MKKPKYNENDLKLRRLEQLYEQGIEIEKYMDSVYEKWCEDVDFVGDEGSLIYSYDNHFYRMNILKEEIKKTIKSE